MTTGIFRADIGKLTEFSSKVLKKMGVSEEDARITARILVEADVRGVESHGVAHLGPFYVTRIKNGEINVQPKRKIISHGPSTALMDGDRGLGFVNGYHAMIEAIERAKKTGAGFVTVRNSTHFGSASFYAMMALDHDMIGIAMTNAGITVLAPGSRTPVVGTNPIAVAAPSGQKAPFVLDMATSVVAGGKFDAAQRANQSVPAGWAIDRDGNPITDPAKRRANGGGLLPLGGTPVLGGYKGFGLGVMVEIFCGILSGSCASLLKKQRGSDHFLGALRIDGFIPVTDFKRSMDEMIEAFEAQPMLPGFGKITVAGGLAAKFEKDRRTRGVPLSSKVIANLKDLSLELGIEYDLAPLS